jgi:hypothetical protein
MAETPTTAVVLDLVDLPLVHIHVGIHLLEPTRTRPFRLHTKTVRLDLDTTVAR